MSEQKLSEHIRTSLRVACRIDRNLIDDIADDIHELEATIATLTAELAEARAGAKVPGRCETCKDGLRCVDGNLRCRNRAIGSIHAKYFCYDYYPAKSIAEAEEGETAQ